MGPVDYVIIALVVLILGGAAWYVWRTKKSGAKCIGCPSSGGCCSCASSCGQTGAGCSCQSER